MDQRAWRAIVYGVTEADETEALSVQGLGLRTDVHSCSICSIWAQPLWLQAPGAQAHELLGTGFVIPRHVGSSWNGDQTCVCSFGRLILYH